MSNTTLRDDQWEKIYLFLKNHPRAYAGQEAACRLFVDGVFWITRTGAQWRFLPAEYGAWNSVYKRFARWGEHAIWEEMHQHFAIDPDMEHGLLDSTVVRAHPCAAGASKKTEGRLNKPWAAVEAALVPKSMWRWTLWATRCAFF
jgi:transposase